LQKTLEDGAARLAVEAPEALAHLLDFQIAVTPKSLSEIQEIYTGAFDLRPDCTPNLGYHLFGDDARRGVFLAELKGRMEAHGMSLGVELPDHITFILNYLDLVEDERLPVIEDCLLPSVTRMTDVLNGSGNPYEHALRALLKLLQHQHEILGASAEVLDVS
jgi:nitrate reductase delta subunit